MCHRKSKYLAQRHTANELETVPGQSYFLIPRAVAFCSASFKVLFFPLKRQPGEYILFTFPRPPHSIALSPGLQAHCLCLHLTWLHPFMQMLTGAPSPRQTDPSTTLLHKGKSGRLASHCWLHLSLCWSDLSSERRESWPVRSVNGVHLRNAKPTMIGNSGQQPSIEPAKFQLGWEGVVTLRPI